MSDKDINKNIIQPIDPHLLLCHRQVRQIKPLYSTVHYKYLSVLIYQYPDIVISCFENYSEFDVDERCALLYVTSHHCMVSSTNSTAGMKASHLMSFTKCMTNGVTATIDPLRMQALIDLNNDLDKNKTF